MMLSTYIKNSSTYIHFTSDLSKESKFVVGLEGNTSTLMSYTPKQRERHKRFSVLAHHEGALPELIIRT